MVGEAVVNINSNVTVQYLDRHNKVIRVSRNHNKATVNMVDGILRLLRGDFNDTVYNNGSNTPDEAEIYIPVRVEFGRVGVKIKESANPIDRRFNYIDRDEFAVPTFDSIALQEPVESTDFNSILRFKRITQVGYTDNNNSECLEFSLYINPGKLVGRNTEQEDGSKVFVPYDWTYYNPKTQEYEAMFTEVGLFSGSDVLLARVLFDGEVKSEEYVESGESKGKYPVFSVLSDEDNPVTQSESTTIVLTWRIGIVSVGKNDEFVTQNNLTTDQFSRQLAEWVVNYMKQAATFDDWNEGYSRVRIRNDIQSEVSKLIGNTNVGG